MIKRTKILLLDFDGCLYSARLCINVNYQKNKMKILSIYLNQTNQQLVVLPLLSKKKPTELLMLATEMMRWKEMIIFVDILLYRI